MNGKIRFGLAGMLAASALLPACGGSDAPHTTSMAPTQIQVATPSGLLAMARVTSETSDPLRVGVDAIAPTDLDDETSDPIPVG